MKKKYFYCKTDGHGQRTGEYCYVYLLPKQIETNRFGDKLYNGKFLYETGIEASLAALS